MTFILRCRQADIRPTVLSLIEVDTGDKLIAGVTGDKLVSLLPVINHCWCHCYRRLINSRCHGIDENPKQRVRHGKLYSKEKILTINVPVL
jgi:hypothetical protein